MTTILTTPTKSNNDQQQLNVSLLLAAHNQQQGLQPPNTLSILSSPNGNTNLIENIPSTPTSSSIATSSLEQQINDLLAFHKTHPSNLLVVFLQTCSAIFQETKIDQNNVGETIKLFIIIMICISEDQYANSLIHDSNMIFSVFLYQAVSFPNPNPNELTLVNNDDICCFFINRNIDIEN